MLGFSGSFTKNIYLVLARLPLTPPPPPPPPSVSPNQLQSGDWILVSDLLAGDI